MDTRWEPWCFDAGADTSRAKTGTVNVSTFPRAESAVIIPLLLTACVLYGIFKLIIGQNCTYHANLQGGVCGWVERVRGINNNSHSWWRRPAGITGAGACQETSEVHLQFLGARSRLVSAAVTPVSLFSARVAPETQMLPHSMCLYCSKTAVCRAFL